MGKRKVKTLYKRNRYQLIVSQTNGFVRLVLSCVVKVSGLQEEAEDSGLGSCHLDQVGTILLEPTQEPDSETSLARFKTLRTDI